MTANPEAWRDEFLAALRFLTRLPAGTADGAAAPGLAAAAWAFPLVGVVIGILGGIVYAIADAFALPKMAAALLALVATMLATGALHEDGLADTADGFGGGHTREHKLEIMRDSRIGTYGVLALIVTVGLRLVALAAIATPWHGLGALVAAHTLARGLLPAALHLLPPARADGLGHGAGQPDVQMAAVAAIVAVVMAFIALGVGIALTAALAAVLVAIAIGILANRAIGGQTGDVLGAIEQGAETAALLAAAAWS